MREWRIERLYLSIYPWILVPNPGAHSLSSIYLRNNFSYLKYNLALNTAKNHLLLQITIHKCQLNPDITSHIKLICDPLSYHSQHADYICIHTHTYTHTHTHTYTYKTLPRCPPADFFWFPLNIFGSHVHMILTINDQILGTS